MPFTKTIPILRVLDEAKAKEFYIDFLGFKIDWGNRASGALFMQISLDECVLHLSEHSGDACPGAAVKLHTDKIEEYVEQLVAKDYPPGVAEQDPGVAEQPWGEFGYGACRSVRQPAHFYERQRPRRPRFFHLLAMTATPDDALPANRRALGGAPRREQPREIRA
jgi:hypothetical protein